MYTHLLEREAYEDRYDRIVVESCRRREKFFLSQGNANGTVEEKLKHNIAEVGWSIEKILITLGWHNKRESTINEWINTDKSRDKMIAEAEPPVSIFCNTCAVELYEESRTTWDRDGADTVLFFMKCSSGHLPMKGVFSDGTELKLKNKNCPECSTELNTIRVPSDKDTVTTQYSCVNCDYTETDSFSLAVEEKADDPEYDKDRARFCLSGDALKEAQKSFMNMENMKRLVDEWKHEDEHKESYDSIAKLEKLTVPQVKEHIVRLLGDSNYINPAFEKPKMEQYATMEFTVEEMQTDNQQASVHELQKLLRKSLETTNWRLMSDGISYRLGLLTGRLRAYESKEELLKLVK